MNSLRGGLKAAGSAALGTCLPLEAMPVSLWLLEVCGGRAGTLLSGLASAPHFRQRAGASASGHAVSDAGPSGRAGHGSQPLAGSCPVL